MKLISKIDQKENGMSFYINFSNYPCRLEQFNNYKLYFWYMKRIIIFSKSRKYQNFYFEYKFYFFQNNKKFRKNVKSTSLLLLLLFNKSKYFSIGTDIIVLDDIFGHLDRKDNWKQWEKCFVIPGKGIILVKNKENVKIELFP